METDSTQIGIKTLTTGFAGGDDTKRPVVFDPQIDDEIMHAKAIAGSTIRPDPATNGGFRLERGESEIVWFDDLPAQRKTCEI